MYVGLFKLTEKGASDIKGWPKRVEEAVRTWEAMGGKTIAVLATMGRYDMIVVGEAPSDEVTATFSAGIAANGNMTTESLRAFTMDECGAMLAKLP